MTEWIVSAVSLVVFFMLTDDPSRQELHTIFIAFVILLGAAHIAGAIDRAAKRLKP